MLTDYIARAMHKARYKILADGSYFGEIVGIPGVWSSAASLDDCRAELQSVLEDWLILKVRSGERIPGLALPAVTSKCKVQYA